MISAGQVYRFNDTGQRFRVRAVSAIEVTLDPIDRPKRQADTTHVGEVFALGGVFPENLRPPVWTLLSAATALVPSQSP